MANMNSFHKSAICVNQNSKMRYDGYVLSVSSPIRFKRIHIYFSDLFIVYA